MGTWGYWVIKGVIWGGGPGVIGLLRGSSGVEDLGLLGY